MILKANFQINFDNPPQSAPGSPSKASELDFVILKKHEKPKDGRTDGRTGVRTGGLAGNTFSSEPTAVSRSGHQRCSATSLAASTVFSFAGLLKESNFGAQSG